MEHWQPIPELGGYYEASTEGRIRRSKPGMNTEVGRVKKLAKNPNGYMQVATSIHGKEARYWVHRLVISAFTGELIDGIEIHHRDGDPENNRLSNLQVVTRKENRELDLIRRVAKMSEQIRAWREKEQ